MKKIMFFIIFISIYNLIFAEKNDFNKKTYQELIEIKKQVNEAIWNKKEWKQVKVPSGIFEIGIDIPAGKWLVKMDGYGKIESFDTFEKSVKGSIMDSGIDITISPENDEAVLNLKEGMFLKLSRVSIFEPFINTFSFED